LTVQEQPVSGVAIKTTLSDIASGAAAQAPPMEGASISRARKAMVRFAVPFSIVVVMLCFVALATLRWDLWTGDIKLQVTDDAYIAADLTQLSSRVAGEVLSVAVNDFQRVRKSQLLVQIDPADYEAEVERADAGVVGAGAALENLANMIELQYATIAQAEAALQSAEASNVEARQEQERQQTLSRTDAGTRQKLEQATAAYAKADADVHASRAAIAAQRHQLEVLKGTVKQRAADLDEAKAGLVAARLRLGYTKIVAPFDGVASARRVQPGDYVNIGANLINVVPLPNVYVVANYKETQLTHVKPGQAVVITVDGFPGERLRGRVERISPASGAQFALLPPDNATGNFTKVVQRIPVRIALDMGQSLLDRLLPGMSVVANIDTSDDGK
jgi:membrane fusion protein, multidrug efflux system